VACQQQMSGNILLCCDYGSGVMQKPSLVVKSGTDGDDKSSLQLKITLIRSSLVIVFSLCIVLIFIVGLEVSAFAHSFHLCYIFEAFFKASVVKYTNSALLIEVSVNLFLFTENYCVNMYRYALSEVEHSQHEFCF